MIAIDPSKANTVETTDDIVNGIVEDVKKSIPVKAESEVYYPGEMELRCMKENMELGIPVVEEKWNEVLAM
ncbi:Malate/L-lactate dehydrogenase [compost metagenome]